MEIEARESDQNAHRSHLIIFPYYTFLLPFSMMYTVVAMWNGRGLNKYILGWKYRPPHLPFYLDLGFSSGFYLIYVSNLLIPLIGKLVLKGNFRIPWYVRCWVLYGDSMVTHLIFRAWNIFKFTLSNGEGFKNVINVNNSWAFRI